MGEESAAFESNEKFARVEERMNHLLNREEGIKTNYSELRNFYSIMGNDVKGAITKRLSKTMMDVRNFNDTYIKGKSPKKDKLLVAIERDFNEQLESMPDINPQNTAALYQYLRELMPIFIQIKAHTAKRIKGEKKAKKQKQHETLLKAADRLSGEVHDLFSALLHLSYFDQYTLRLIRAKANRDVTRDLVRDIHAVVKQTFKTGKNEHLDIVNLRVIDMMTTRIRIRLTIYEACALFGTYNRILKSLPRQLVQQFNTRYFARRRDSSRSIEELKDSAEYKGMTKKFITLKLKKYYNLLRLYQLNVNRLFLIEDRIQESFTAFLEKTENNSQSSEKRQLLEKLQADLDDGINKSLKLCAGLPRSEDLKKNSIRTLYGYVVSFYYNVLKDTYTPLSCRDIAVRLMKQVKPPKDMMLNATELKFLDSDGFKRDEPLLSIFFQGIISLITGEEDEMALITPLMEALGENTKRERKSDLRQKTINKLASVVSPAEFDLLIQIFDIVPRDQERINTDLGKLLLEIAEKYPAHLKWLISRAEKVEPTDSEKEKARKIVTEKFDRLLLKSVEYRSERPSPVEYLKKVQEEEATAVKENQEAEEMLAGYNISSLITHWKNETETTVAGLILGTDEKSRQPGSFRELSRSEISMIDAYFNSEHLGEIEKQYKTLNENIGETYLKAKRPYSKTEYVLLYAARRQLMEFRNPTKTFPRLHERLGVVTPGK